ncbi:MAG: hypothetical protein KJ624_07145 [Chloroflexi bacterium]|jgi:hypothetical protein|nr:hypothetical protein [Chloroflexota bacterium]
MINQDLIRALEAVPEKKLRLLELAKELVGPDGKLDMDRAVARAAEVDAAVKEARAYISETEKLKWALQRLSGP